MDSLEPSSTLRMLVSLMHKELRKQISLVCNYSMTELQTISLLSQNNYLLPSQLAASTRVKVQSMSQILKKLSDEGMIYRENSKDDKRKVHISLTPFGKETIKEIRKSKDEWLQNNIETTLNSQEKKILKDALPILQKLIEKE